MEFVGRGGLEGMGGFGYWEEEGRYCGKDYKDEIGEEVKEEGVDKVMELEEEMCGELCDGKIGEELKVMIEGKEGDYYMGGREFD